MEFRSNYKIPKPPKLLEHEPLLPTLYLESDTTINLAEDPSYLYLENPEHSYSQSIFPLNAARAILAFEPVEIKPRALSALLRSQIPLILFSQSGEYLGRIEPTYTTRPDLIKAQALMQDLMQMLVWSVLRRCRRCLLLYQRHQRYHIR
ncbi:CRISPR-associated endonuclease Cas1 [Fischerella sp. PCC 9605]|uniref:CRISPR-associated endonuclease Cas1 n=1 Tax=Fischerella sp. PCC 9605 TaxID=1173024 RepID=UPI0004AF908D|nr:CRISPR-associated endonuclease Cas1 [Fischerella sp. PCC 9605]